MRKVYRTCVSNSLTWYTFRPSRVWRFQKPNSLLSHVFLQKLYTSEGYLLLNFMLEVVIMPKTLHIPFKNIFHQYPLRSSNIVIVLRFDNAKFWADTFLCSMTFIMTSYQKLYTPLFCNIPCIFKRKSDIIAYQWICLLSSHGRYKTIGNGNGHSIEIRYYRSQYRKNLLAGL